LVVAALGTLEDMDDEGEAGGAMSEGRAADEEAPQQGASAHEALVPVRWQAEHREMWRVVHNKVVAVRAEPSNASVLVGTRRPGARVIVACREGDWLLLHPDEGYGLQSAWMLVDGAEMGLGILMQLDAGKLLQLTLEASSATTPSSTEVLVNVRAVGSGANVDVKVPREAKVFEVKLALAEFLGRPEVLERKLLRRKSDEIGFAARTDNPGYTSLKDGDDLGLLRQLFVTQMDLLPKSGSAAERVGKELLPEWVFRTEYRPLSLLDTPWVEDPPERKLHNGSGSSAAGSATPAAAAPARPSTGPLMRARAPPHLRAFHGGP